jgi:hypothetical protein
MVNPAFPMRLSCQALSQGCLAAVWPVLFPARFLCSVPFPAVTPEYRTFNYNKYNPVTFQLIFDV